MHTHYAPLAWQKKKKNLQRGDDENMCPKPKTIINVGLSESKITSLQFFFNAKRWKDAANEERDGKIEKN